MQSRDHRFQSICRNLSFAEASFGFLRLRDQQITNYMQMRSSDRKKSLAISKRMQQYFERKSYCASIGVARGPWPPKSCSISSHFVLWEAVSQTKYRCSLKVKIFVPKKDFGLATPLRGSKAVFTRGFDELLNSLMALSLSFRCAFARSRATVSSLTRALSRAFSASKSDCIWSISFTCSERLASGAGTRRTSGGNRTNTLFENAPERSPLAIPFAGENLRGG